MNDQTNDLLTDISDKAVEIESLLIEISAISKYLMGTLKIIVILLSVITVRLVFF